MKTAVITGTSRGIGLAVAKKFLDEGWLVVGTSTSGKSPIDNKNFECFQLDLVDGKSIAKAVQKIKAKHPQIDVLINNAGISLEPEYNTPVEVEKLRQTFEVNVFGLVGLTQCLLPYIRAGGQIVNISSRYGSFKLTIEHDGPAYSMSKAAVNMYTLKLARALASRQISVSAVHPGWVKTDMGGPDAELEPHQAAENIFNFITSNPPSGHFWFEGKIANW